jgi:hypothetical protein
MAFEPPQEGLHWFAVTREVRLRRLPLRPTAPSETAVYCCGNQLCAVCTAYKRIRVPLRAADSKGYLQNKKIINLIQ